MLVQNKSVSTGDVVVTKLINGDELIGKLKAHNKSGSTNEYVFDTPVVMQMVPAGNGQVQVVFAPFLMGIDDGQEITVQADKMLIEPIKARSDASKQYLSATSKLDLSAVSSI